MGKRLDISERIQKSRIELLMKFPFIGQLSLYLKLTERPDIKTAATDGVHYFYNRDFVKKLTDKELNFLTAHEVLHVVMQHIWRGKGLNRMLFNIAADYVINGMIKELDPSGATFQMIKGALYNPKFSGLYTEEVYEQLLQNANQFNNVFPLDNHDVWIVRDATVSEESDLQEQWRVRTIQAHNNPVSKQTIEQAKTLKRLFKHILEPQKNWRQLLHEFLEYEVNDYSFTPPNRRMNHMSDFGVDVIFADWNERDQEKLNIVFAVDTSGSISDEQFQLIRSEIIHCVNQFGNFISGKLIYCDSKIDANGVYDLVDAESSLPVGGGGTDFRPVFDWVNAEMRNNLAGLVYLTDGEGRFPKEEPPYPVLWLMLATRDDKATVAPFGTSVPFVF